MTPIVAAASVLAAGLSVGLAGKICNKYTKIN